MVALADAGLEDISCHFLLCCILWARDGQKDIMLRKGREVRSRTDCIIGKDLHLFQNVSYQDPRHNTEH